MLKKIAVPLDKIKLNPWRDLELFPIDHDHVEGLKASIKRHGFVGIKAREEAERLRAKHEPKDGDNGA
jgi:hypothetical protein